jgi:hypothetical protein
LPEIHGIPCGTVTAICCVVSVHTKHWYYLRLMAFLRVPKTVPKINLWSMS